uniref:Class A beta-lactamase-related serine hydrolase n=1 Tax=Caldilinea aerophila TaxID=133453 RepID=A0A7C1JY19_9CHLR
MPDLASSNRVDLNQRLEAILHTPGAELASLAVVIYAQGHIQYEGFFGYRWIDPQHPKHSLPVTAQTKFRVASISKLVTALAVMQLVERGLLALDADVSDVLGWRLRNPHWPEIPITLRMLLTHTSSLRDGGPYTFPPHVTLREVLSSGSLSNGNSPYFAGPVSHRNQAPGHYFSYCNLGFGVLGTLIESISGERFDRYVDRHILQPLGLDASFHVCNLSDEGIRNLATLYRRQHSGMWDASAPWVAQVDDLRGVRPAEPEALRRYRPGDNGTIFSPQGGLRISARDLIEIMKVFLHEGEGRDRHGMPVRLLRSESVRQMLTVQWRFDPHIGNGDPYGGLMRAWGLGVHLLTNAPADAYGLSDRLLSGESPHLWGHTGDAYGLLGALFFEPQQDVGFVYLIGGVGRDPETYKGVYSAFYRWEEEIQSAIWGAIGEHIVD